MLKRKVLRVKRIQLDRKVYKCHKTHLMFELQCEFCTTPFFASRRSARFCGTNCRVLNYLDTHKKK